jgi:8-oxo-dGTP diphosphatase
MNTNILTSKDPKEITHPAVTVTMLIFSVHKNSLHVLLFQRNHEPFKNIWSIPGGLIRIEETVEDAARRILKQQTGMSNIYLEQLHAFSDPRRDPRERRISIAHYALVPYTSVSFLDDTRTKWCPVTDLPILAFDHNEIIAYGKKYIKKLITTSTLVQNLLSKLFRLSDLQKVYEVILEKPLDKRNFRKKILSLDLLEPTGLKELDGRHRPAMLYKFKTQDVVLF